MFTAVTDGHGPTMHGTTDRIGSGARLVEHGERGRMLLSALRQKRTLGSGAAAVAIGVASGTLPAVAPCWLLVA